MEYLKDNTLLIIPEYLKKQVLNELNNKELLIKGMINKIEKIFA